MTERLDIEVLPLDAVTPDPDQPRQHFDEQALDELAASIAQHGLLQPIVVRPMDGGYYGIVAGERRWRATGRAGLPTIQASILRNVDDETAFVLATMENVNRRDLRPVEEAKAYQRLRNLGRSADEIAELFGKTKSHIETRLDLLRLAEPIQALVDAGQLSRETGWYMSRLSHEGQYAVVRQANAGLAERELSRLALAVFARESQPELLSLEPDDPFADGRRRTHRSRVDRWWASLEDLAAKLDAIEDLSAYDLAQALGPDTDRYAEQLRLLGKQLSRLRCRFDQAQAARRVEAVA